MTALTTRPIRILVTGSRDCADRAEVFQALDFVHAILGGDRVVVVHGAARGADTLAAEWAKARGQQDEPHPADWDKHGRQAGFIRNQSMVALGVRIGVAFPKRVGSPGTRDTMDRLVGALIPFLVFPVR